MSFDTGWDSLKQIGMLSVKSRLIKRIQHCVIWEGYNNPNAIRFH